MKRDMDLARRILIEIEAAPYTGSPSYSISQITDFDLEEVNYHIMLLEEIGLIKAKGLHSRGGKSKWLIERLTFEGHEFLEAAKNETIWQKAKKLIQDKGGALTFEVAKAVLAQVALKQVVP